MGKGKDRERATYSFYEAKKGQKGQWSSNSAWNYTWSPGWTDQDRNVLTNALMKFGIGRWKKLDQSKVLPGKSIMQCYLMTQRLLGQQSIAGFMGLHLDV